MAERERLRESDTVRVIDTFAVYKDTDRALGARPAPAVTVDVVSTKPPVHPPP
jgi:hypothetical protein